MTTSGETPPKTDGVPILAATQSRLKWKAVAAWVQVAGSALGALAVFLYQNKEAVTALLPSKFAAVGAVVFFIGKCIEGGQRHKDLKRKKPLVNYSPKDAGKDTL